MINKGIYLRKGTEENVVGGLSRYLTGERWELIQINV